MKIISIYYNERLLIRKAARRDRNAQYKLYEKYAPKMLALCRSYVKDLHFAEDVMQKGFLKAFTRIGSFLGQGSFEAWMRRIMIRESINFLKKKHWLLYDSSVVEHEDLGSSNIASKSDADFLIKLIDQLPDGFRLVFMLHAIEGYTHKEIAKVLNIPENTSRSKLSKARKILQEKVKIFRKKNEAL